jgi:hypothetical protein
MIVARWSIDARFGHKPLVAASLNEWLDGIGSQIGWTRSNTRLLTGSVGAPESRLQMEVTLRDLAELNACWEKLGTVDAHKQWSKELEPHVVSGSPCWEVLRVL